MYRVSISVAVLLAFAVSAGVAEEVTVDDIVDQLRVNMDEVVFNPRGRKLRENPKIPDMKVWFEFNSALLSLDAQKKLNKYGEALNRLELRDSAFLIAGHTDAVGGEDYNLNLSKDRAGSVARYLIKVHDIALDRLSFEGHGESELADPANPTSSANRRVEIINLGRR